MALREKSKTGILQADTVGLNATKNVGLDMTVCVESCVLLTTCSTDAALLMMMASLKSGRSNGEEK